ncbi:MAG TPA: hypothetical protein VJ302_14665 [Blastocatellia bacterium]|nr:hypothetical protein [Blastocatellia bacterium]
MSNLKLIKSGRPTTAGTAGNADSSVEYRLVARDRMEAIVQDLDGKTVKRVLRVVPPEIAAEISRDNVADYKLVGK